MCWKKKFWVGKSLTEEWNIETSRVHFSNIHNFRKSLSLALIMYRKNGRFDNSLFFYSILSSSFFSENKSFLSLYLMFFSIFRSGNPNLYSIHQSLFRLSKKKLVILTSCFYSGFYSQSWWLTELLFSIAMIMTVHQ